MVLYPGVLLPVSVARPKSLKLVRSAHENDFLIGVSTQTDKKYDNPSVDQLYPMGTVAQVVRILEMPDNSTTVILEGKKRFILGEAETEKPYLKAKVTIVEDVLPDNDEGVFAALVSSIKDLSSNIINNSGIMPPETTFAIRNIENPTFLINYVCVNFGLNVQDKQRLLEMDNVMKMNINKPVFLMTEYEMLRSFFDEIVKKEAETLILKKI